MFNVITSQQTLRHKNTYHSNYNGIQAGGECIELQFTSHSSVIKLHHVDEGRAPRRNIALYKSHHVQARELSITPF
jgi:hypothetical protein